MGEGLTGEEEGSMATTDPSSLGLSGNFHLFAR
mgnify:CR=1 FL=1